MKIIKLAFPFNTCELNLSSQVLALGDFDGIHLGHQKVIQHAVDKANSLKQPAAIMTFDPHPRAVLGQTKYEFSLTPWSVKMAYFSQMGVQFVYVVHFTTAFAKLSPEIFVEQVLCKLGVSCVVVGFDFSFGHNGTGTPELLMKLSQRHFQVDTVPAYHLAGDKVSSTYIRELLKCGSMEHAKQLLGRAYSIRGIVTTGEGRGRKLGFPTANIEPDEAYVLPGKGVYAVLCHVDDKQFDAVMNIGTKPTFSKDELKITLEVHLLNFNEVIYGKQLEIHFMHFIREERKFNTMDDLVKQIDLDCQEAKRILDML